MGQYVNQYKKNPFIRQYSLGLVRNIPPKFWFGEIASCFNHVRSSIRYTQDINGVETLHTPLALLTLRQGDCDDMCTLLATLLAALGYQSKFRAIGFEPDYLCHVFLYTQHPDTQNWIALDPTEPNPVGWEPPGYTSQMDYEP